MSVKVMSYCFDAKFGSPNRKAVAVALADHADDQGERVWPSVGRLADKTELSTRTVQRALRELEDLGLIIVVSEGGQGPKDTREYKFNLSLLRDLADGNCIIIVEKDDPAPTPEGDTPSPLEGDTQSPILRLRVTVVQGRVTGLHAKGDTQSPEPSREPLGTYAQARARRGARFRVATKGEKGARQ